MLHRIQSVIQEYGVGGTVAKACGPWLDRWFDLRYCTDTCTPSRLDSLTIAEGSRERATFYQPTRVLPLRKLFPAVLAMLPEPRAFVDLGCGKGRVLLIAAEAGFPVVRGVEFARELCDIARANWNSFQSRARITNALCEIVEADVSTYRIRDDETVFFIFNPFDEIILERVLENIAASVISSPRRVLVIFFHPKERYKQVIAGHREFRLIEEKVIGGNRFDLYGCESVKG